MIHVIATIELHSGQRDAFLDAFHQLVPLVLEEDGCLDYGPTVDLPTNMEIQGPPRDDVATIVERWESLEALEAHLMATHMLAYREKVKEMVKGMTLQILQPA